MTQIVCECNEEEEDFPGGPGDTNPPARAGDGDSISGLGRFRMPRSKQAPEPQLPSPWAATIKAGAPEACAPTERPPQGEPTHRDEEEPRSPQPEKAQAQQWRLGAAKKKN